MPKRPSKKEKEPKIADSEAPKAQTTEDLPPQEVETAPLESVSDTKADKIGVPGLPIDLEKLVDGKRLYDKLSSDLAVWLKAEIDAQQGRISKLDKWENQYNGKKPEKNYPYVGCHNTSIPLSMFHTDAVTVRIMDGIFSQKKTFIVQAKQQPFFKLATPLEEGLDWWVKFSGFKKAIFSPMLQAIKTGTGIVKLDFVEEKRTVYRYATEDEAGAAIEGIFDLPNGQKGVKQIITSYKGPKVMPISREDWVISSDATCIKDAFMCGFKVALRPEEIKTKIRQGIYVKDCLDHLKGSDEIDESKKNRVEAMDREMAETGIKRYDAWEVWLKYDVDGDGEEDDVVITYHLPSRTIFRAIYNPYFMGFRPFKELVFMPAAYQFDGKGVCEVLEKLQEEVDSVHNQRLDRMDQINASMYVVSSQAGIDFKVLPGMVYTVDIDPTQAVVPLAFPDVYHSTFEEEGLLNSYAEKTVGISPQLLGQQTSERPVAQDTISLIQEANKKFKFGIDNIRDDISEIGMMVLEMIAQYQPEYKYFIQQAGKFQEKRIDFPNDYLRDGVAINLAASSEMLNTEARRQIGLTLFQLLSTYMDKAGASAMAVFNPQVPPEFKKVLAEGNRIGVTLMKQIVRDFGIFDENEIVLDVNQTINTEQVIAQQEEAILQAQMQQQMQGPQQPPEEGGPPAEEAQGPPDQFGGQQ